MRNSVIALLTILLTVSFGSHSKAQDKSHATQKPADTSQERQSDQAKNEVDRALEEAKKNGETVLAACLDKCKDSKEQITSGVVSGHAIDLPQPAYPVLARKAHASG